MDKEEHSYSTVDLLSELSCAISSAQRASFPQSPFAHEDHIVLLDNGWKYGMLSSSHIFYTDHKGDRWSAELDYNYPIFHKNGERLGVLTYEQAKAI